MAKEENFQNLIENAPLGVYILGRKRKFIYTNKKFSQIFGYSQNELLDKSLDFIVHPEERIKVKEFIQKCFEGRDKSIHYEFTGLKKDRTEIKIEAYNIRTEYEGKLVVEGILMDITPHKKLEEKASHLHRVLKGIRKVNQLIAREKDKFKLLQGICNILIKIRPYKLIWIALIDEKNKQLVPVTQSGLKKDYLELLSPEDARRFIWPSSKAIKTGKPYIMENIPQESKFKPWRREAIKGEYLSSIAIPLVSEERVWGAINICSDRKEFFDEEEITFLREISSDVAHSLKLIELEEEKNKLQENISRSFNSMAQTIVKIFAERDPYTAKHLRRVAEFARLIAEEIGLNKNQIRGIWIGGILHDIGKIGIPEAILVKPGKLSSQEIALIKTHPEKGYNILIDMKFPWPVAQMALQHHERLDGTGYPRGIKGNDIILEAKILAVCDILEAMSSHRPYRPAKKQKETLAEIKQGRGVKYDSRVVDIAIKLIREGKIRLKED